MSQVPPDDHPAPSWSADAPQPAGAAAGVEYGGFWIRVVAFILDGIIIGVLTTALVPLFGGASVVQTGPNTWEINYGANALGGLIGLVYFIGFWTMRGQSAGMIPFRLRVVKASDGTRLDWVTSLLRYVGLIISFVVIFIGVIWAAFDSRKQGWHDKIAGTLVVRDAPA